MRGWTYQCLFSISIYSTASMNEWTNLRHCSQIYVCTFVRRDIVRCSVSFLGNPKLVWLCNAWMDDRVTHNESQKSNFYCHCHRLSLTCIIFLYGERDKYVFRLYNHSICIHCCDERDHIDYCNLSCTPLLNNA